MHTTLAQFLEDKISHSQMVLRPTYPYQLLVGKATRYGRDFIPYYICKKF